MAILCKKNVLRNVLTSSAFLGFSILPYNVLAQDVASANEPDSGMSDIVVTAQRRSESVQKVPISLQVLTSEALSRQMVVDTRDLSMMSPTINYQSGNSATGSAFSLRGVSSSAIQAGIQPSTALVVDGVVAYTQAEFVANLSDIDHIEVLNGPQGTLFGKNSTAGVISIVTKQPTGDLQGKVEASVSSDEEVVMRGMINVPISQAIRLRINGFYQNQKPLLENVVGPDALGQKAYGISAKLAFDLSEVATFTLAGDYVHSNSSAGQFLAAAPGIFESQIQALNGGIAAGRGVTKYASDIKAEDIMTTKKVTGTLDWSLSDSLKLTSITNYTQFNEESNIDSDNTPSGAIAGRGPSLPGSTYPFQYFFQGYPRYPADISYYSQELRLNFKSGPLDAVFGAYYQNVDYNYALILVYDFDGSVLGPPNISGVRYTQSDQVHANVKDRTLAFFGDVTYALSDQFKLFGGLRYTHEQLEVAYHRDSYFGTGIYNPFTGKFSVAPTTYDTSSKGNLNNLSGRMGVQFQPSSDMNFYASFSKGYKAPAVDIGQTLIVGKNPIIKPEKAAAYEVGAKLRSFGGKLALNGALFYEEIKGIQASILDPKSTTLNPQLLNAGRLKTLGFEGDASWAVTPEFRLTGALAYVKATYAGFVFGGRDVTGDPAVGSPKWKYTLTGNYERGLNNSGLKFFSQLAFTWTDDIQYQLGNDPLTREPSHGMMNAAIGVRNPEAGWEIQIFGKNLTDEFYYINRIDFPLDGRPVAWIPRDFHRFVGIKMTGQF